MIGFYLTYLDKVSLNKEMHHAAAVIVLHMVSGWLLMQDLNRFLESLILEMQFQFFDKDEENG